MIRYMRLVNFRRHVETELRFDDSDHIVLIAGNNGVGKSTLFEAVLYALYGEGRNGRGNIERLIRKGAELEGMEVEIHFDVGSDLYQVRRRRDSKLSSALLFGNDVALTEGSREVTAAITDLLGMDAKGFRLATYAQQRELDGLASMRPSERGHMLSRLLRLDVVARAKDAARAEFRHRRDLLRALGNGAPLDNLRQSVLELDADIAGHMSALEACRASIAALDAEVAAGGGVDAAYHAASAQRVRLLALVHAAEEEVRRAQQAHDALVVPESISGEEVDIAALRKSANEVEAQIANGETQQRQAQQVRVVQTELERCRERVGDIDRRLLDISGVDSSEALAALTASREELQRAQEAYDKLRNDGVDILSRHAQAVRDMERVEQLDATCVCCGQDIDEAHRMDLVSAAREQLRTLTDSVALLEQTTLDSRADVDSLLEQTRLLEERSRQAEKDGEEVARLTAEREELQRREGVYSEQLSRLDGSPVELSDLYGQRVELAAQIERAERGREIALLRAARLEQKEHLARDIVEADKRRAGHQQALDECLIPEDLAEAYHQIEQKREARDTEIDIAAGLQAAVSVAEERRVHLSRDIERGEAELAKRSAVDNEAQVAMWSHKVLDAVETSWAQHVRPALEGTVSELAMRLSDGRFDAVSFDTDYNVSVRDRGVMRSITDLSGGEIDLVALAVRLGLASVVAERHATGGMGFLILDECFGSQDPDRRQSILTALRGVKSSHGQIFLISHVGGLEDAADSVITVELNDDAEAVVIHE